MLARYTILHQLGRGATGSVYEARDRTTGAVVALKRLDPALLDQSGADFVERFLKRAREARRLKHANIVEVYDAGEAAGTAYVAMERLEGESLRRLLDAGPLPLARAVRIAHDIASGLAHAHLEGVVHGGLKPSNVVVLRSGAAKITDFGTAQAAPCPEKERDHRCDLFALGTLLYEMLAQRPPGESPRPPSELNPHVPRTLDAIVLSMLAAQPADRMAGVPILLRELERIEEGLGLASAAAPQPRTEPELRTPEPKQFRDGEPTLQEAPRFAAEREEFLHRKAMMERGARPRPASRRSILPALAVVLASVGIGYAGFMYYSSTRSESPAPVAEARKEPVAAFGAWQPASPHAAVDEQPQPIKQPEPEKQREPVFKGIGVRPIAPPPMAEAIKEPVAAPATMPPMEKAVAPPSEPQPARTAQLVVAVSPRGDLYIDGEPQGRTPPMTTFDLTPGMHRIEVRNGSRKPYLTYMTVEAGDVRRIHHDFDAKPSRPPG